MNAAGPDPTIKTSQGSPAFGLGAKISSICLDYIMGAAGGGVVPPPVSSPSVGSVGVSPAGAGSGVVGAVGSGIVGAGGVGVPPGNGISPAGASLGAPG